MTGMSGNEEIPSRYFADSSQLTNWNLDSGSTFHIIPHVSDFILGSLYEKDKYIEIKYDHHVTANQKGKG